MINRIMTGWIVACCLTSQSLPAQVSRTAPDGITDVGIDDKSGDRLPLKTSFTDSNGNQIPLGKLFDGERPVLLTFNYASCPLLCKLQLTGLVESLKQLEWTAGDQFRVVSISIDPSETVQQASISKQNHLQAYGRAGAEGGWSFLKGTPQALAEATAAAGFRYKYLPKQREFSHTAATIVCTPDGVISRYLYGVQFDPDTVRLSLTEAADGGIGSPMDQLLLFCFRYDSATGKYAPAAWNLMRLGAITTVLLLGVFVIRFRKIPGTEVRLVDGAYNESVE
jgi:protein SCO1